MTLLISPDTNTTPIVEDGLIHLVGKLDDAVFSFLGMSTAAMAEHGVNQTVILEDDPAARHLLTRFHPDVRLVLLPYSHGLLKKIAGSFGAMKRIKASGSAAVVHLHGFAPIFSGLCATRLLGLDSVLYGSLHGAEPRTTWSKLVHGSLLNLAQWISTSPIRMGITSGLADSSFMGKLVGVPTQVVAHAVDPAFFQPQGKRARRPLVSMISRNRNRVAASLFSQLAVLLNGKSPPLSCHFLGTTDDESAARLHASEVKIFDASEPSERARHLFASWMYVDFGGAAGFPVFLAEAMAAGLPCIAWNTAVHRDLIKHDRTGLLCDSHEQMLAYVTDLIESPERRLKLGNNARIEAMKRFEFSSNKAAVVAAYGATGEISAHCSLPNSYHQPDQGISP